MSASPEKWTDGLRFSSLFWPPPNDEQQRKEQVTAYVEYFAQFTSEEFPKDIGQLIESHYPSKNVQLLDEVLATFVLQHPEYGRAIIHPILSLIIDGTLVYDRNASPFLSFIYLFSHNSEDVFDLPFHMARDQIEESLRTKMCSIKGGDFSRRDGDGIVFMVWPRSSPPLWTPLDAARMELQRAPHVVKASNFTGYLYCNYVL